MSDLLKLLVKLSGDDTVATRKIICTPVRAKYGSISAWVISVNGSPPRLNVFVDEFNAALVTPQTRKLGTNQHKLLFDYCKEVGSSVPS